MNDNQLLITGATSGLGKDCSIHFNNKYNLVCIGKNKKNLLKLKKLLNNKKNIYLLCNFNNQKSFNFLLKKLNRLKNISKIIHCAGGGLGLKDPLIHKKDYLKLLDTNFFSVVEINRIIVPNIIKKKIKSTIITISSVASVENTASIGYTISKKILNVYSKMMSKIFISKNIFFKNLILGAFEGSGNSFSRLKIKNYKAYKEFKKTRLPRNKYSNTKEIIPVIEFLMDDKSSIISGSDFLIDYSESSTFKI